MQTFVNLPADYLFIVLQKKLSGKLFKGLSSCTTSF